MQYNCQRCEETYEAKRKSSKFCSAACRVAAHKKIKADRLATETPLLVSKQYQPTGAESILTLLFWRYQAAVDKLSFLARRLPASVEATELSALFAQLRAMPTPEVVVQVTGYDLPERLENAKAFKLRTSLPDINIPAFI